MLFQRRTSHSLRSLQSLFSEIHPLKENNSPSQSNSIFTISQQHCISHKPIMYSRKTSTSPSLQNVFLPRKSTTIRCDSRFPNLLGQRQLGSNKTEPRRAGGSSPHLKLQLHFYQIYFLSRCRPRPSSSLNSAPWARWTV